MATTTKLDPKTPGSAQRTTPRPAPKTATSQPARNKPAPSTSSAKPAKKASASSGKSARSSKPKSASPSKTSPNAFSAKSGSPGSGSGPVHNIKVAIHTAPVDNSKPSSAGTFGGPPPQAQSLGPAGPMPAINHPTQNVPPTMTGGLPQPGGIGGVGMSQPPAKRAKPKPLPKGPAKEPAPTKETRNARKRQTAVLSERQKRETQGKVRGAVRDVDAGAGFWPPLSPLL